MLKFVEKIFDKIKAQLSQKGQGMVEYALIIAFIAGVAALALNSNLSSVITGAFDKAGSAVENVNTNAGSSSSGGSSSGASSSGSGTTGG